VIKWQKSALLALLAVALLGCDEDTENNFIEGAASNIILAAAWNADSDPHGVKINPDSVGSVNKASFQEHDFETPVDRVTSNDGSEAFSFDYDSMLSVNEVMLSEQRTVSFWLKLDQTQRSGQILSIMDGSHWGARGREPFLMYDPDSETLELWRKYHGSTFPGDTPPVNLIQGVNVERELWYHLVVTSSLDNSKIFLNGELVATGEPIGVASHSVHFGRSVPSGSYPYPDVESAKMTIDNIRLYQNDISLRYVKALYNSERGVGATTLPPINPTPSSGVKNIRVNDFELSWEMPPEFSAAHDMSFNVVISDSESFATVLTEYPTTETSFKPDFIGPGKKYYWRVDVVNAGEIVTGNTWSFTAEAEHDLAITPDEINVMAYNIWYGGDGPGGARNQELIYEQITDNDVDIVFLQESYGYQQVLAEKLGFSLWPDSDDTGQNITVLTRFPVVKTLLQDGNFVGVRLDLGEGRELDAYSTWLPYGDDTVNSAAKPDVTNEELTKIDSEAGYNIVSSTLPEMETNADGKRPIIVGGDYNTISHLDYTDESNRYARGQLFLPTLQEFERQDFIDSYREVYPDETKDTCFTWTPFFKANPGQGRVDFIHYKGEQVSAVAAKCLLADGHQDYHPSDHGAVISTFKVNKDKW
jgi:exonuclease III